MSFLELLSLLERHRAELYIVSSSMGYVVRISNSRLAVSNIFPDEHITKINGNASEVLIGEICEMIKQLKVAEALTKKAKRDGRDDLSYYVDKFPIIDTYNEHLRYMGLEGNDG